MAAESNLQSKIIKWLKSKGCFTFKLENDAGDPDIIALIDGGGWIALEVKKEYPYKKDGTAKKGAFRPLQQEKVRQLDNMYYARIVWPENWLDVKAELEKLI